tara:strand:+ start:782 stop:1849 length:1068 start_codon:yes stop_codon:yes gene_type:complete
MINSIITGSGSYIPKKEVRNEDFLNNQFYKEDGTLIESSSEEIISKFQTITGINSRRYLQDTQSCSEIASNAAERAIESAGIDREDIDMIIVAQNFGDVVEGTIQTDNVPSIASRVKHNLGIKNQFCVPYDIIFGCPGWIQGMIQAHMFIRLGEAKKCLVIGAEALSRVVDPHDRDTMIFADGAGATIIEAKEESTKRGILAHATVSHCLNEKDYLFMGESYNKENKSTRYIKMNGHKIYQYALTEVPKAMKHCLDKIDMDLSQISKILIHQANEKMDQAILKRLCRLYKLKEFPENIMPMTIDELGNSSVATVPTLYDLIMRGELKNHKINSGENILFASVGAGMNINCFIYEA